MAEHSAYKGNGKEGEGEDAEEEEKRVQGVPRWVNVLGDDVGVVMRRRAESGYGLKDVRFSSNAAGRLFKGG